MIGKISGTIDHCTQDSVLITTACGVGYVVHCSDNTLALLRGQTQAMLYTDLVVRQDIMQLYGFLTIAELEWYRLLTKVQGVGARVAVTIIGTLDAYYVKRSILEGDWRTLTTVPSVGAKLAQRIVNELKDKSHTIIDIDTHNAGSIPEHSGGGAAAAALTVPNANTPPSTAQNPLSRAQAAEIETATISALVNLGYDVNSAARATVATINDAMQNTDNNALNQQTIIRGALRRLSPTE